MLPLPQLDSAALANYAVHTTPHGSEVTLASLTDPQQSFTLREDGSGLHILSPSGEVLLDYPSDFDPERLHSLLTELFEERAATFMEGFDDPTHIWGYRVQDRGRIYATAYNIEGEPDTPPRTRTEVNGHTIDTTNEADHDSFKALGWSDSEIAAGQREYWGIEADSNGAYGWDELDEELDGEPDEMEEYEPPTEEPDKDRATVRDLAKALGMSDEEIETARDFAATSPAESSEIVQTLLEAAWNTATGQTEPGPAATPTRPADQPQPQPGLGR